MKTTAVLYHDRKSLFLRLYTFTSIILLCIFCYEVSYKSYQQEYSTLSKQFQRMEEEKIRALTINSDLHLRVNSQSDPAWIELTLIEGLGVCPEGHQKVVFVSDRNIPNHGK